MASLLAAGLATLVFCAPGYPGAAGDAQPYVDQFAKSAAASAGWQTDSLAATYDPSEQGGLAQLGNADSILTFVPYAFYVQYASKLHLAPLAQADVVDVGTTERWTLVAKAGLNDAASLSGYTLLSVAGYAPEFVRRSVLQGSLPADVHIESTGQVLSALRRAAAGEKVAVLLDQTQAGALATLPFAAQLKTLAQSSPLPVALVAVVDSRLPAARAKRFQAALLKLGSAAGDQEALRGLHLKGFVPLQLPSPSAPP